MPGRGLRTGNDPERDPLYNRSATQRGHGRGHHPGLEVRRHGGRQTVPYYIYFVHDHRNASGAILGTAHYRVVAFSTS